VRLTTDGLLTHRISGLLIVPFQPRFAIETNVRE